MQKLFALSIVVLSLNNQILFGDNGNPNAAPQQEGVAAEVVADGASPVQTRAAITPIEIDLLNMIGHIEQILQQTNDAHTALVDLDLLMAQPQIKQIMQNSYQYNFTQQYHLSGIPGRVAKILKTLFRASQMSNGSASKYKKDIADMLVIVHTLWCDEDRMQKQNFESWSNQLFDQLHKMPQTAPKNTPSTATVVENPAITIEEAVDLPHHQEAAVVEVAGEKEVVEISDKSNEHESVVEKPVKPQKASKKRKKADATEDAVSKSLNLKVTRSAPRQQASADIKHHSHSIQSGSAERLNGSVSNYENRLKRRKTKVDSASQPVAAMARQTKADSTDTTNSHRRKNSAAAQTAESHPHALGRRRNSDQTQKHEPRTNSQKPAIARETAAPKPVSQTPSNSGTRSA